MAWYNAICDRCGGQLTEYIKDHVEWLQCPKCFAIEARSYGRLLGSNYRAETIGTDQTEYDDRTHLIQIAQVIVSGFYTPSPLFYPKCIEVLQRYEGYYLRVAQHMLDTFCIYSVLDVCSGPGTFLEMLARQEMEHAGLDKVIWPGQAERHTMYEANMLDPTTIQVDQHYDMLTLMECLEHFPCDIRPTMRELINQTTPNYIFVSAPTINFGDVANIAYWDLPAWHGEEVEDRHYKAWSVAELTRYLHELGYKVTGWSEQWMLSIKGSTNPIRAIVVAERE